MPFIDRHHLQLPAATGLLVAMFACDLSTAPPSDHAAIRMSSQAAASTNHALSFLQSYVYVHDQGALDLRNTWTLEAWVFPRAAGNGVDQDLISKWDGVTDAAYILQ